MEKRPLSNPTTPIKTQKKRKGKMSKEPDEPSPSASASVPSASESSGSQAQGRVPGSHQKKSHCFGRSLAASGPIPNTNRSKASTSDPLSKCKCRICQSKGCKNMTGRYILMDTSVTIPRRQSKPITGSTRAYFDYLHNISVFTQHKTKKDAFALAQKQRYKRFAIVILPEHYIDSPIMMDPYAVEVQLFETPGQVSSQSKKPGTTDSAPTGTVPKKTKTQKKPVMYFNFWLERSFDPRFDTNDHYESEEQILMSAIMIDKLESDVNPPETYLPNVPDKPDAWEKLDEAKLDTYPRFDPNLRPRDVINSLREHLGKFGILKCKIEVKHFPYPGYTCYIRVPFAKKEYEGTSRRKSVAIQIAKEKVLKDMTGVETQGKSALRGSSSEESLSSVSIDSRSTEGSPDWDNEGVKNRPGVAAEDKLLENYGKDKEHLLLREVMESVVRKDKGQMLRSEEIRRKYNIPEGTIEDKRSFALKTVEDHMLNRSETLAELRYFKRKIDLFMRMEKKRLKGVAAAKAAAEAAAAAAAAAAAEAAPCSSDSKNVPSTSGNTARTPTNNGEQMETQNVEETQTSRKKSKKKNSKPDTSDEAGSISNSEDGVGPKDDQPTPEAAAAVALATAAPCSSDSRDVPSTSAGPSANTDRAPANNAEQMETQNVEEAQKHRKKKKKKNKKKKSKPDTSEEVGPIRNSEDDPNSDQPTPDVSLEPTSTQRQDISESASWLQEEIPEQMEVDNEEIEEQIYIPLVSQDISAVIEEGESKDISDEDVLMSPEDARSVNEQTKGLQATVIKEDIPKEKTEDEAGNATSTPIDNEEVQEITNDESDVHPRPINVSPTQIPEETSTSVCTPTADIGVQASLSDDESTQISAMGHAMAQLHIGSDLDRRIEATESSDKTLRKVCEELTSKPAASDDLPTGRLMIVESNKPIEETLPPLTAPDQDIAAILSDMFLGDSAGGRSKESAEIVQGILRLPNDSFKNAMLNSALQWALKNPPVPCRPTQIDSTILEEPTALPLQTSDSCTTSDNLCTSSIAPDIMEPTAKCGHESSSQGTPDQTLSRPDELKHIQEQRLLLTPAGSSQQQEPSGSSGESKDDIAETFCHFEKFLKHVVPHPKTSDQMATSAETSDSSLQRQEAYCKAENLSSQALTTFQTKTPESVSRKLFKDSSPQKSSEKRDVVPTSSSQVSRSGRVIEYGYLWKRQNVEPPTGESSRNDPQASPIIPGECAIEPQTGTSSMSEGPQPSQLVTTSSICEGNTEPTSSHKSEPPTPRKDESGPSSSRAASAPNSSKKQYTKTYSGGGRREQGECFYEDNYYYQPEAEIFYERERYHQNWSPSYPPNQGFRWNQYQGYRGYSPRESERRFGRGRRRGGRREPRGPRESWRGPRGQWGGS